VLVVSAVGVAADDAPLRFRWKAGDTLTYKVGQTTTVDEVTLDVAGKKPTAVKTLTKLTSAKKWVVKEVDADGVATLEMSVTAMRQEVTQTVGDGKPNARVIDSTTPDDAKDMPFLGKPILTVKVNAYGELSEAKSDNPAAADRLQVELPFRLVLPEAMPKPTDRWERAVSLKLPPPVGTGEAFAATQTFTFQGMKDVYAVVGFATTLKDQPTDPTVWPAVIPSLWQGDLFFNTRTGAYHGAKLTAKKEVANPRGEGTKFAYTSEYTEALDGK
jgi:hypothetical protein